MGRPRTWPGPGGHVWWVNGLFTWQPSLCICWWSRCLSGFAVSLSLPGEPRSMKMLLIHRKMLMNFGEKVVSV